jgi:hypothetical protein
MSDGFERIERDKSVSTRVRCAIYTRKSTEEGLEQDINSLHAQREAAEAYVKSQKDQGWTLPTIPQVVDGANWQTTFVLTNTTASAANVSMSFQADSSAGNTTSRTPPFLELSSTASIALGAGSTLYLHTPGTATKLTEGYAIVTAPAGVVASVISTIRNPGHQDVKGTSIATASSTRVLVPFDNTPGTVTSVGIVNPTSVVETVSVKFMTANGTVVSGTFPKCSRKRSYGF